MSRGRGRPTKLQFEREKETIRELRAKGLPRSEIKKILDLDDNQFQKRLTQIYDPQGVAGEARKDKDPDRKNTFLLFRRKQERLIASLQKSVKLIDQRVESSRNDAPSVLATLLNSKSRILDQISRIEEKIFDKEKALTTSNNDFPETSDTEDVDEELVRDLAELEDWNPLFETDEHPAEEEKEDHNKELPEEAAKK